MDIKFDKLYFAFLPSFSVFLFVTFNFHSSVFDLLGNTEDFELFYHVYNHYFEIYILKFR